MTTSTILLILLSIVVAAGLSYFQYYYKTVASSKVNLWLAILRFATIFAVLLLLINPLITVTRYEVEKTPLPVVVDNSASVEHLGVSSTATEVYNAISQNPALKSKFDIQPYRFSDKFEASAEHTFLGNQSNIERVATDLQSINKSRKYPTILITDGNQTQGNDYLYSFREDNRVYPVILGDTTTFTDIRISRVNVNKYAFHKNQFPVEVFVNYSGKKPVVATLSIKQKGSVVHRQNLAMTPGGSVTATVLLPANSTGLQVYEVSVTSAEVERNMENNVKKFAVEVIDQRTEVALVSDINHPDLGALKRSIESNPQRKVTLVRPGAALAKEFNVYILYQPTSSFRSIYDKLRASGSNVFTITGTMTDFSFLNQQQDLIDFKMSGQAEDYLASYESQFNVFALDDIGFGAFPPLRHTFGNFTIKGNAASLLTSRIRNIDTGAPLLLFSEEGSSRQAHLFGENIWKWRMHDYVENRSFEKFDLFIDKVVQYLATNNTRKSLIVNHERFYNSGDAIQISAQFFNKNYELDNNARLTFTATNRVTKESKRYDLLKANNSFKVNLDGLKAGEYDFTVRELNTNTVYSASFEILEFDIEKQFVNPDVAKLNQLAARTDALAVLPGDINTLIKQLVDDPQYVALQRAVVNKSPLIDSIYLLVLLAILLASEWFIRKYNGLM